jgi:hypothetical protein
MLFVDIPFAPFIIILTEYKAELMGAESIFTRVDIRPEEVGILR